MNKQLPADISANQRLANLASYFILAAMMVCVSVTFSQSFKWFLRDFSGLEWEWLPLLAILVSLEAIFTRPVERELEGLEWWIYHFAEWITIAVLLKITLYFVHGFQNLIVDLPRWREYFSTFFEGEFLPSLGLLLGIWLISRASANDIEGLNIDPSDLDWDWEFHKLQNDRSTMRGGMVDRLLWTGIGMVILTAGVRINIGAAQGADAVQAPVLNIMVYFFLALILFSLTQYALLTGRWFWYKTPIAPLMPRSWLQYGIIFFALLTIISFVLPTNYSMGLLETLNILFNWFLTAVMFISQLILLPILWLLSLTGCTRQSHEPTPEIAPPTPSTQPPLSTPIPWLELIQSVLFWGLFIGIIAYALIQFARQNPQIAAFLKRIPMLSWVGSLWQWLSDWFRGASGQVAAVLHETRRRLFPARGASISRSTHSWLNFRQLTPRQQIVFYYLRLAERGAEHGLKRKAAETPYQYARALQENLPDVNEDITGLTEAFLEARYSNHPIDSEHTSLVQRFWRNITRSLNRLRSPRSSTK